MSNPSAWVSLTMQRVEPADSTNVRRSHRYPTLKALSNLLRILRVQCAGSYSISKLAAFDQFRHTTSDRQALAIVALAPLPGLAWTLLMECTPMGSTAAPRSAWQSCWPWVFRHFMGAFIGSILTLQQIVEYIPAMPLPWKTILVLSFFQGLICIGVNLIIMAGTNTFPVPFSQFTPVIPMHLIASPILWKLIRRQRPPIPDINRRFPEVSDVINAQTLPLFLYPIYAAMFMQLSSRCQAVFSLLLPVLRNTMRSLIWKKSKHDEDIAGGATAASGQLFHVLFTATCLQNAKSLQTLAILVAWDMACAVIEYRDLLRAGVDVANLRQDKTQPATSSSVTASLNTDAISCALSWVKDDAVAKALNVSDPLLLPSPFHAYQIDWVTAIYETLHGKEVAATAIEGRDKREHERHSWRRKMSSSRSLRRSATRIWMADLVAKPLSRASTSLCHAIHPEQTTTSVLPTAPPKPPDQQKPDIANVVVFINEVASTLHHTEMLLLRAYVGITCMLFYGEPV